MIFSRRHDMLELTTIPRERKELQNMINGARRARKRRRLTYWAAANISGWALYILITGPLQHHPPSERPALAAPGQLASVPPAFHPFYLPLVTKV